jgi:hypothetical protein
MQLRSTARFDRSFTAAPPRIQKAIQKQLAFLLQDLRHPSLHTKRFPERGADMWQARVTKNWRFYFVIEGDTYDLIDMIEHPK